MKEAMVEKTLRVIDSVSQMECIKPYVLVGGTALALQLKHRMSEDLDFMRWRESKSDKREIAITAIKRELEQLHTIDAIDIFEFNHVEIHIDQGVKLSFYVPDKRKPDMNPVVFRDNLILANVDCIAALKMELLMRRTEFRDYYDFYCILKDRDADAIRQIIANALHYSEHRLKSKNLTGILTNPERFGNSEALSQLAPKYSVSARDIEQLMIAKLKDLF
jgi:predicted nucleotidyltransferase component of viral defense system